MTANSPAPAFEHRASFPLAASPERSFRALVDAGELEKWFAEHASVEARVGGAYRFFGGATLGAPKEQDATQRLTSFEPGRALSFRWTVHGVATYVAYTLKSGETADTSKLEIVHTVFGELPFRNPKHVIADLWSTYAGNLREHLEGGRHVVLPDFSGAKAEVRVSIEIAAPPAKVFRALLDPALIDRWLGGAARVDLASRTYSYGWKYDVEGRSVAGGPTRILEMVENQKLVTDWPDWRGDAQKPDSRVTWLLEPLGPEGNRTRLTLIHDGFELVADRGDYQQGWGGFLDALKALIEA
jgi:uncharacterized protein YndB with AHSA1/START domain